MLQIVLWVNPQKADKHHTAVHLLPSRTQPYGTWEEEKKSKRKKKKKKKLWFEIKIHNKQNSL